VTTTVSSLCARAWFEIKMSSQPPSNNYHKKRKRTSQTTSAWKDLPAFLDASSSVSAGIFGSRRLPELKHLHRASVQEKSSQDSSAATTTTTTTTATSPFASGGGQASSRHLRRRTTSRNRRIRHRFPAGNGKQPKTQRTDEEDDNDTEEAETSKDDAAAATTTTTSTSRRAQRSHRSTLCREHYTWQSGGADNNNKISTETVTSLQSKIHWMTSHLWHAKRFHMDSLFGWKVPIIHINRGARASLRLAQTHSCLQDVTWKSQPLSANFKEFPILLQALVRICPNVASSKAVLCGSCIGQGVLYEVDQFPRGAIGPAQWMIQQHTLKEENSSSLHWSIYLWVHPSIRPDLDKCLQLILPQSANDQTTPCSFVGRLFQNGTSCLQLRGAQATSALCRALSPSSCATTSKSQWDWNAIFGGTAAVNDNWGCLSELPHGAIFLAQFQPDGGITRSAVNANSNNAPAADNISVHISKVQKAIDQWSPSSVDKTCSDEELEGTHVLLVWNQPRDLSEDHPSNQAVCGWDIFCSPSIASQLFCLLTMENACPIGMVDEAHLMLECHPPMLVFPRDFVDTRQGQLYWGRGEGDNEEFKNWQRVRLLLEGGWGRLPVTKMEPTCLSKLSFGEILTGAAAKDNKDNNYDEEEIESKDEVNTDDVVVVRGSFGQPFCDALAGCCVLPPITFPVKKQNRRKRRRVRLPTQLVHSMAPSNDQASSVSAMCHSMLQSLSLPAVIPCHLTLAGPGKLLPGTQLVAWNPNQKHTKKCLPLGIVTAGGFSSSRGVCHGVGILGASRLLEILAVSANETERRSVVILTERPSGNREIHLLVDVQCGTATHSASLSLLI
jgi:hypothetical protein